MKPPRWRFTIEDHGSKREAVGDALTLTDAGQAKFWYKGKLVGCIKAGEWTRIYVAPTTLTETLK